MFQRDLSRQVRFVASCQNFECSLVESWRCISSPCNRVKNEQMRSMRMGVTFSSRSKYVVGNQITRCEDVSLCIKIQTNLARSLFDHWVSKAREIYVKFRTELSLFLQISFS